MKLLTPEEIQKFTPPSWCPKLADLADHCNTGAGNVFALLKRLGERFRDLQSTEVREHPAIAVIIGQISYLLGESPGPTCVALENYGVWKAQPAALATKRFKVVSVSSNTNSFGLSGIVLVAEDGEAFEAAHNQHVAPLAKGGLVTLSIRQPGATGTDRYGWAGFEIPRRLPAAPAEVVREAWQLKTLTENQKQVLATLRLRGAAWAEAAQTAWQAGQRYYLDSRNEARRGLARAFERGNEEATQP